MLGQPVIKQLTDMRLWGMLEAYQQQLQTESFAKLSFEERFSLITEQEYIHRKNNSITRYLAHARLRYPGACIEDLDFKPNRNLDRFKVHQLANCQWVAEYHNLLISGQTGVGKTYLVCALGHSACRNGYSTRYYRLSKLLNELSMAKSLGNYPKLLNSLEKCKLLIIDDFGLNQLNNLEARELLEIIESRYQTGASIIASQFPIDKWYETITDPTLADAIIDRIIHNSTVFNLTGESMRKIKKAKIIE